MSRERVFSGLLKTGAGGFFIYISSELLKHHEVEPIYGYIFFVLGLMIVGSGGCDFVKPREVPLLPTSEEPKPSNPPTLPQLPTKPSTSKNTKITMERINRDSSRIHDSTDARNNRPSIGQVREKKRLKKEKKLRGDM